MTLREHIPVRHTREATTKAYTTTSADTASDTELRARFALPAQLRDPGEHEAGPEVHRNSSPQLAFLRPG